MAQFLYHLHVVLHTLFDALCLDAVTKFFKEFHLFDQVVLNVVNSLVGLLLRRHEEVGRIEFVLGTTPQTDEGDRV